MALALAGGRRPSLIAGPGGLPRSGRWRGLVFRWFLHPFCRLSTLRCCVPPPASGRGWVLSAGLIGMWSLLFQSVRQVEDFVPHHVENAGSARGVAQDLAAESVLTGYMRCRGTRGISAILEKWPIPLSGANPPVSGVYHTTVKNVFFVLVWQRLRRHGCTRTASSAQPHPHNRHRPAGERRPDALPMRPQEVLDESHQGESHE